MYANKTVIKVFINDFIFVNYLPLFPKALEKKQEELKKKRLDVERKARRGEIDPMHEHVLTVISLFSGLNRHELMKFIFEIPTILEDLDVLFKDETARRVLFYYQVKLSNCYVFYCKSILISPKNHFTWT